MGNRNTSTWKSHSKSMGYSIGSSRLSRAKHCMIEKSVDMSFHSAPMRMSSRHDSVASNFSSFRSSSNNNWLSTRDSPSAENMTIKPASFSTQKPRTINYQTVTNAQDPT